MSINMNSKKIKAQFAKETNPRVGLIVLSTDNMIEKDFSKVLSDKPVDLYVNRIKNYNPVTAENLKKMSENITSVADNILPGEKVDCVVFGCTSGTIVSGFDNIKKKINLAKPNALVTAPSTAALNALKKKNIKIDNQLITEVLTVNGVRFSLTDGSWGLIRASSNKPSLVVVTESPTSIERKKNIFDFIDKLLQETGKIGEYDQKI